GEGDGAYEDVNLVEAPPPLQPAETQILQTVKPEAIRQAPPPTESSKAPLTVDPPAATFPTTGGKLTHVLKNPRPKRMVYKIKCSNNYDYGINPVYGFVEANTNAVITVTRLAGAPKEDKMVIQFVEAPAEVPAATKILTPGAPAAVPGIIPQVPPGLPKPIVPPAAAPTQLPPKPGAPVALPPPVAAKPPVPGFPQAPLPGSIRPLPTLPLGQPVPPRPAPIPPSFKPGPPPGIPIPPMPGAPVSISAAGPQPAIPGAAGSLPAVSVYIAKPMKR
ncbi:MSP domain protein, partial [Ancylostoma duodenale]